MIKILELFSKGKEDSIIDYMRKDNRDVVVWDVDEFVNTMNEVRDCVSRAREQ